MMTPSQLQEFNLTNPKNVLDSLSLGLHQAFSSNPNVILLGEDILDPYGGAFKVTRGLSSAFPDRVITTPISEAGIIGLAGGMALRGLLPVVEIMFGDFLTLGADQIINHLTKFNEMYNFQVNVPVVIRTPMGGRRGYGPTHSQTLEKHFLGVSGLRVMAPFNALGDQLMGAPGQLLVDAILQNDGPLLFIENKQQYLLALIPNQGSDSPYLCEEISADSHSYRITVNHAPQAEISLAAYGYMAHLAMQAQLTLAYEHEIFSEIIVPTWLSPFNSAPICDSVQKTGRLLTIEEGTPMLGWGAEVLAQLAENSKGSMQKCQRLTAKDSQIPARRSAEEAVLPQVQDIVSTVQAMCQGE